MSEQELKFSSMLQGFLDAEGVSKVMELAKYHWKEDCVDCTDCNCGKSPKFVDMNWHSPYEFEAIDNNA